MKKIGLIIISVMLTLSLPTTPFAAPITGVGVPELSELDTIMATWMETYGFTSATLAVSKDEKLVYEKGYGYMDKNLSKPMLPYARMRLATNSVALTKRAVKQLIADGLLTADALVYQVVNLHPWQGSYVDHRMQQMTVQQLIDGQACIADKAKTVKEIGLEMGLGRNATLAESIQYQWSDPDAMRDPVDDPCALGNPADAEFSHYAMEIAAYIIAKTVNPAIDNTDYTAVGTIMGNYINNHIGAPIGSVFLQAENIQTQAHENEVWYDSDNYYYPPEWNRYWDPTQPNVPQAYSPDFYARPGSGTLVSSGRDILNYLNYFRWETGEPKPESLIGWEPGGYINVGFGSLPGTTTIVTEKVDCITGESGAFVVLVNKRPNNLSLPHHQEITNRLNAYLSSVTQWPDIDLFDYVYTCTASTASLSDHLAANRVYTMTDTSACDPVATYYATGSDEDLGDDASAIVTLKENPPGYFTQGTCQAPDMPPQITLLGDNPLYVEIGSAYVEPGYVAQDDMDGDITNQVVITGSLNTSAIGTYYMHYDVTDTAGNPAGTATRTIQVVSGGLECVTAANSVHLTESRAYRPTRFSNYYAVGSGDIIGRSSSTTTSLQETSPNNWKKVERCD